MGRDAWHLAALLAVLLLVQAPRLGGEPARIAAPIFARDRGFLDFDHAYYPAGLAIRHRPAELYRGADYDSGTGRLRLNAPANFVNIPIVAWLFAPFSYLRPGAAGTYWLAVNIGAALASLLLLLRLGAGGGALWRWGVTAAFMTSGPLLYALNLGQTTPLVLLALLLGARALLRGREARAGAWLAAACLVKIPPLLFLPYFLLRRRRRLVATASAVLLAVGAVSLLSYGWPLHANYFDVAIRAYSGRTVAAHNCQSIDAVLARLFTDASLLSWRPIELGAGARALKWGLIVSLLAACAGTFSGWRGAAGPARQAHELAAILCLSVMAFPIAWVHYGVWLLPAIAVVGAAVLSPATGRRGGFRVRTIECVLLLLAVFLINIPVPPVAIIRRFSQQPWFRLTISHQFAGTLLLFGLCLKTALPSRVEFGRTRLTDRGYVKKDYTLRS